MISTQYIKLNMVPNGIPPVLYCSQYDVGRPLGLVVYNGSEVVDLSTYTATIEATRTDRTPITAAVTTDGNIGVFNTTATMTNKLDRYGAKLVLSDSNGNRVASLVFFMVITLKTMDENAEGIQEDQSLYQQYTATVQTIIAQIRSDLVAEANARQAAVNAEASARQAADQTLQQNINAEASARQSADNTLQSNINAEASTRATQDASLQSQIDQLVAPSGEAPSAAEVENARIGADGVTYPTLGDAIRTNDSLLKSALDDYNSNNMIRTFRDAPDGDYNGLTFVADADKIGFTVSGTASDDVLISYQSSAQPIPGWLMGGASYEVGLNTANTDIKLQIYYYATGSSTAVKIYDTNENGIFTMPQDADSLVITLRIASGTTISPGTAVHPYILNHYSNRALHEVIMDGIQKSAYLGTDYATHLSSGADLNSLGVGNYIVPTAQIASTIVNTPIIYAAYRLIVTNTQSSVRFTQIAICNTLIPEIYVRTKSSDSTWNAWAKIAIDNNYDYYLKLIKKISGVTCEFIPKSSVASNGTITYNGDYTLCIYYVGDRSVICQVATDDQSTSTVYAFYTDKPVIGSVSYNNSRTVEDGKSVNNVSVPTGCKWIAVRCSIDNPTSRLYPLTKKDSLLQPTPTRSFDTHQISAFDRKTQNGNYRLQSAAVNGNTVYLIGCHSSANGMARLITINDINSPVLDVSDYVDIVVGHGNDMTYHDGYLYIVQAQSDNGMDVKKIFKVDPADGTIVATYTAPYGVGQIAYMNGKFYLGMNSLYSTDDFSTYTKLKPKLLDAIISYAENILGITLGSFQTFTAVDGRLFVTTGAKEDNESIIYNKGCVFCLSEDMQGIDNAYVFDMEDYEELQKTILFNNKLYFISDGLYYPTIRTVGGYKRTHAIPENSSLNGILAIGEYYSDGLTVTDAPTGLNEAFHLSVKRENDHAIRQTIYTTSVPSTVYTRIEQGGVGWGSWSSYEFQTLV